jgi:hypothetical protein
MSKAGVPTARTTTMTSPTTAVPAVRAANFSVTIRHRGTGAARTSSRVPSRSSPARVRAPNPMAKLNMSSGARRLKYWPFR